MWAENDTFRSGIACQNAAESSMLRETSPPRGRAMPLGARRMMGAR